jgi:GNAT superfamily N-acetyltransferase
VITIGSLRPSDRRAWEALFRGYVAFYEQDHPQSMYDRAWSEFQDGSRMHALGGWLDGRLVGFAHFLTHARTTAADVCYLEDLFTAPEARGPGVARALIDAVAAWAAERGCSQLYWHTRETNATARRLYDAVTDYRGFIVYTMALPAPGPVSASRHRRAL